MSLGNLAGAPGGSGPEEKALALLLQKHLLHLVQVPYDFRPLSLFGPLRLQPGPRHPGLQLLAKEQGQEGAEDVAAERLVPLVVGTSSPARALETQIPRSNGSFFGGAGRTWGKGFVS